MIKQQNIVLFSSGISEQSGMLREVEQRLTQYGYICSYWRDLFVNANNKDSIALLPMLIKKIPTFDFAVLICEGHDKTVMYRNGRKKEVATMRDNVLFEIGLCVMALGLNRTILLTDAQVHLPEDLVGKGSKVAVKQIIYSQTKEESIKQAAWETVNYISGIEMAAQEIDRYIRLNSGILSPVVIGAAVSTACGYVGNFIFRTLEHIQDGVVFTGETTAVKIPLSKIFMHIILPYEYLPETPERAHKAIERLQKGSVPTTRFRNVEFYYEMHGDEIHICDYPTTLVTSYNTAKMILEMDADDALDIQAEKRFTAKELDLFETTLKSLLSEEFIRQTIEHYYKDDTKEEREALIAQVTGMVTNQVVIERRDY